MIDPRQKQAHFIVYRSPHGRGDWTPVLPQDVPEWVKDPDVMGEMARGNAACKNDEGPTGSDWFRADKIDVQSAVQRALNG